MDNKSHNEVFFNLISPYIRSKMNIIFSIINIYETTTVYISEEISFCIFGTPQTQTIDEFPYTCNTQLSTSII